MKLLVLVAALAATSAVAQAQSVAMLNMAMYNERANVREPTDSAKAVIATDKLRDTLSRFPGLKLVDPATIAAAEASAPAVSAAGGKPCNVIVACARAVGKALGVRWVVMGKVSKTSNLIWLFSGELINVETGELTLDDDCELKGDPNTMVPAGVGIFANRISKRVSAPAGA
jgi:TolB-like protein